MIDLVVPFVTGLTAGGLSCLAVQGGLLTTSMAQRVEQDQRESGPHRVTAEPIVLFLVAKLLAYTLLGALLGALGSFLALTPLMQGALQFAAGVFMIGNALRLLNVHPIFRYFALEPPKGVTRFIRRRSKRPGDAATPAFLGALTVLIPCGVTQTMMALAIATGDAWSGAAVMFAFTLGASPLFFTLAYLATRLGQRLERVFLQLVAGVSLVLGVSALMGALTLLGVGTPNSLQANAAVTPTATPRGPATDTLEVQVVDRGYVPGVLYAKAGVPVTLTLVTQNSAGCARAFTIPRLGVREILPETGRVVVHLPPQRPGTLPFACSMGMYGGQIQFQ
ncbi:sulfite exporter TauE/SafE family protein [Deinococcus sp. QL22]|uniref:sulfite exporter TauE/SafE family protein n=1 Tax=Deinococcus sp. QL22 TaxID=2939437 RepID=UPI0020170D19|nr:sulfite exporter TauE/SafE family protein [Deinococcus sp. QL22]UQN08050.1 sulfite exporter TauE/SafE family protein [Deinococcus sp. QL22]